MTHSRFTQASLAALAGLLALAVHASPVAPSPANAQPAPSQSSPPQSQASAAKAPAQQDDMLKSLRDAAEQGSVNAQTLLGTLYMKGMGVAQDPVEAVKWFRKGAEQGDAHAQNFLGESLEQGLGLASNPVMAYLLFELSAAQGNSTASFNRDRLAKKLSPDQQKRAKTAATKWKPYTPLPALPEMEP